MSTTKLLSSIPEDTHRALFEELDEKYNTEAKTGEASSMMKDYSAEKKKNEIIKKVTDIIMRY